MVTTTIPFRRRRLARRIRRLREAAGMTQEQAAAGLDMSTSALSRKETGEVATSVHEVRSMMDLYDTYDEDLLELARAAKEKPWWHAYGIKNRGYFDLEEDAISIREWQLSYVPGLLQAEEYTRAIFKNSKELTAAEVENAIAARMRRGQRLTDAESPLGLTAIVEERVLTRPVGGAEVMRRQLRKILEINELPNVSFQVVPHARESHHGLEGSFTLLSYPEHDEPDILYIEHTVGAMHVEKDHAISMATRVFERLRAEALNTSDSAKLVHRLAGGH
ncbi:helix-turn-helix protein [Saccharopolyspora erythraea NRRL 2338]|uniref:Transcriptional regulator, XRE family n=2 Tax=Saccharopolyspora erythraea TaxID=1836 RepID=A4F9Z3_SACEN|nr:helix-turn-helix transcriptional regulator [Saccharopolyspora erythraea]EQD85634.1 XRE family transcriptional regulator [Saccharopolyspora erythraea D]PFG94653.1 helix-turn-helix protein [Saccharopolyspora erythraea NRRL 2338]QRK91383.1 helix-turn-helix domain-containing protein [Saccharopolyspora erythraea]CAM00868.1 transcriptional regulator, XRE family [Saccharopolyspora erythraea NRRL 2338]